MTRSAYFRFIGLAAAFLGAWLIGSCAESPSDFLIPNQPPTLAIAAGPIRDSVDVFIVTFNWNASDLDGQVTHFIYAIDDTAGPGAWIETTSYELTLLVTAADSAGVDSIRVGLGEAFLERYRFRDAHTFFLKAIDDDGAVSAPAALSFTAETFAPETQILIPFPGGMIDLGATFTVTWRGTDIDGTEDPVGYSWRIVPVDNVILMTAAEIESTLYDPRSPGEPWTAFSPSTSAPVRGLEVPHNYIFGVVALDQAGAIEPRLRIASVPGPTNVLRIRASETGGQPELCVSSSIKRTCFPGVADEQRTTFQIPANSNITFTWEGDASHYGGRITGYSYGIDLDSDLPDDPGWRPESAALTRAVVRFDLPPGSLGEDHFLSVRVRDDIGSTTVARILLVVIPLSKERDVLLVDDFGIDQFGNAPADCDPPPPGEFIFPAASFPQDQCHDQFLREAIDRNLAAIGHADWVVDRYEPLEPLVGTVLGRTAVIDSVNQDYWVYTGRVDLVNLARYKLVIWNVRSDDGCQLRQMNLEGEDNFLAVFIEAGGHVWISGTGCFRRSRGAENVGLSLFGFEPRHFLYRFLKLESEFEGADCLNGCFRNAGSQFGDQRSHGFAGGYASPMAEAEGYPESLRVSRPPFAAGERGIPDGEAMVVPHGLDINARLRLFDGQLDTLYFYLSNGRMNLGEASYMDEGACALRYSDPGQGKLMVYGFPLYFLTNEVDDVMVASFRWFLEP